MLSVAASSLPKQPGRLHHKAKQPRWLLYQNSAMRSPRPLHVVPPGFPKVSSYSGQLSGPQELTVKLPQQWVPGSLEVSLNVFPSSLADLQKGLDGILREPNGCFEQASTSNYPNVMTMQYMQQHDAADPAVIGERKTCSKRATHA